MPNEEMSAGWNTEGEIAMRREPDIEDVDGPDRPVDVAAEWIRSPGENWSVIRARYVYSTAMFTCTTSMKVYLSRTDSRMGRYFL